MKPEELNNQLLYLTENLLDNNHTLSFRMQGYSMYPTLKEGDLGQVEKCSLEELKIGDIVVFKAHNKLIAHRLIDIYFQQNAKIFIAKGDKNNFNDSPFTSEELIGKVTSFQRKTKIRKTDSFIMRFHRFTALYFLNVINPFYNLYLQVKNKFNYFHLNFQSIKANVSLISKNSGKAFLSNSIISVLQGIMPFVIILCVKLLIDQLTKSTVQDAHQQLVFIFLLIITALSFLVSGILTEINSYFSEKLSQSVTRRIYEKLHVKHADLDLSNYENPGKQDKMHRAVQEASFRPIKMLNELLIGIKSIASSLFLVGMFLSIRWYLVLVLFIAIIPGVFIRLRYSKKLYKLKESQNTKEREIFYFNRILTGFPFAKELKLFGFADFFKLRFTSVQNSLFEEKISLRKSEIKFGVFAQIFAVSLIFISLGFVSLLKIRGEISIGTVVLFFFAFQRGYSVLNDFFQSFTRILEDNTFLKDFIEFLNLPTHSKTTKIDSAFSLKKEIRFENVSFRYESSKRDALNSINLVIPAGKTVAFVGANGSGKTTLIKLLCGFYEPDSGQISFDGIDTGMIGQIKICENITAVFQDFALYNLAALENIRLGDASIPIDMEKAKKAAQSAGIDEIIERLPDGYNTLLGSLFKGGEELSIGQWQKMAIARAFYRDSPLLLMDEPSSALDVDSEMQIIDSLKKLSHQKTAVIVSHRLSTVEWVDLIYFFHNGEVLESGNHKELMAMKGKYYNLFQTANKRIESDSLIDN
jgi:ATP-binding cassette, subfamily B, bacterial